MRSALTQVIVLSMVEASAMNAEENSSEASSEQQFVDTSTWEQIIRVLEESCIQSVESESTMGRVRENSDEDLANAVAAELGVTFLGQAST